jgi:hypothetical protein
VSALRHEALSAGWGEPRWLFPSTTNTPLDHSHVSKAYHRVLKAAGLPAFRLYDLRHTFASLLLARCAPITYVANQLGHAKPTTTLAFYTHHMPAEGRSFADLVDGSPEKWNQNVEPNDLREAVNLAKSLSGIGSPGRTRTYSHRINSSSSRGVEPPAFL